MSIDKEEIKVYLNNSKTLALATVNEAGEPDIRTLGGYGVSGLEVYFATAKESNKVKQLESNNEVAVLFQHENQTIPDFVNITLYGRALLAEGDELGTGRQVILNRRPQLSSVIHNHNIYKIKAERIKVLDFKASEPAQRVSSISL